MIDDASAIIVQVVVFAAAKILPKEESSVSSRAGRIAVGRVLLASDNRTISEKSGVIGSHHGESLCLLLVEVKIKCQQ